MKKIAILAALITAGTAQAQSALQNPIISKPFVTNAPKETSPLHVQTEAPQESRQTSLNDPHGFGPPLSLGSRPAQGASLKAAGGFLEKDVAGDSTEQVRSIVSTPHSIWIQSALMAAYLGETPQYTAKPSFSTGWDNDDPFLSPNTTLIGGHQDHDDGYLKVIGAPWGAGDLGGAVVAISETDSDQGAARNGAGNDDAISLFVNNNIFRPRIDVGAQATQADLNSDGISRSVFIGAHTVTITPQLNAGQMRLLRRWMRIYTNYDLNQGVNAKGGDWWSDRDGVVHVGTSQFIPNVYYGYVSGWTSTEGSTTLNIVSNTDGDRAAGWRTAKSAETITYAPGSGPNDILDASSDHPTWTYTEPNVFIGMAGKSFNMNQTVACVLTQSNRDSLTRACEGNEIDLFGGNDPDQTKNISVHGLTIGYSGEKAADDSYNLALAGNTNTMLSMSPGWYSTTIDSDQIYVGQPQGPQLQKGATAVLASFGQSTEHGAGTFTRPHHTMRYKMWSTRNDTPDNGAAYHDLTYSLGLFADGTRSQKDGIMLQHIDFNPVASPGGVDICANDATCLTLASNGSTFARGDVHAGHGKAFYTNDPNGANAGYIYADTSAQMNIKFDQKKEHSNAHLGAHRGAQGAPMIHVFGGMALDDDAQFGKSVKIKGNLEVGRNGGHVAIVSANGRSTNDLMTDANGNLYIIPRGNHGGGLRHYSYVFSRLPSSAPGTQFFCSNCYSTQRASYSADKGLLVVWNGSTWVDGVGNAVMH